MNGEGGKKKLEQYCLTYTTIKLFHTLEYSCFKAVVKGAQQIVKTQLVSDKKPFMCKLFCKCCYYRYLLLGLVMEKGIWIPTIKM